MRTCQAKPGLGMVECPYLLPAGGAVAILATCAKLPAMWIFAAVAARTVRGGTPETRASAVAPGAWRAHMAAGKRNVGHRGMIEHGAIEADQAEAAPLVLAVAALASAAACRSELAMEPLPARYV